jgi:uncharacterized repeat protein (TIGR03803 family)
VNEFALAKLGWQIPGLEKRATWGTRQNRWYVTFLRITFYISVTTLQRGSFSVGVAICQADRSSVAIAGGSLMRKPQTLVVTIVALTLLAIATPAKAQSGDMLHNFAGDTDGNYEQGSTGTYTVLHAFAAGADGAVPSPILRDAEGNIYGATKFGGITSCGEDTCGTVFKIDSAGNETILYRFEGGENGYGPFAGLARDAKGNLYGTTQGDGFVGGASVVFKVDPQGQETVLFVAGETAKACCLDSPVAVDAEGNLYGMSPYGGKPNCGLVPNDLGCGTLFKITPSGKFSVIHVFKERTEFSPREVWSLTPRATSMAPQLLAAISSANIQAGA